MKRKCGTAVSALDCATLKTIMMAPTYEFRGAGSSKVTYAVRSSTSWCALVSPRPGLARERFDFELTMLKRAVGCKNVVQLLGASSSGKSTLKTFTAPYLILELAPHGSIVDLIDTLEFEGRRDDFSLAHVDKVIEEVENGLDQLQKLGFRHNDLRPQNVLIFYFNRLWPEKTRAKLCDLEDCAPGPREDTGALHAAILAL